MFYSLLCYKVFSFNYQNKYKLPVHLSSGSNFNKPERKSIKEVLKAFSLNNSLIFHE